jgi:hypothetical protein
VDSGIRIKAAKRVREMIVRGVVEVVMVDSPVIVS